MSASAPSIRPRADRDRALAGVLAGLFGVSLVFPLVASASAGADPPTWLGVLDVLSAAALLAAAMRATALTRGDIRPAVRDASYRFYRALATVPMGLFVVFLLLGDRVDWHVLLPGLAWRAWVLVYTFPAWLALRAESGDAV